MAELSSINVEDLGTVGRLFGALISKAGIPVPTEITQKVLTAAQHIGKGNTNVPGFDIPPVEELLYGQSVTGEDNILSVSVCQFKIRIINRIKYKPLNAALQRKLCYVHRG